MRHLEWLFFFPPNFLTRKERINKILPEIVQLLKLGRLLATRSLGRSSVQKLQPRILWVEFNFVCLTWWCSGWQNDQDEYERHNYGRVSVRLARADKWLGTYNNNTLLVGSTLPKNDQNWLVGFWQLWIFSTLSAKQGVVCFCRIHCLYWNERFGSTKSTKISLSSDRSLKIFDIWPRSWNYEKKKREQSVKMKICFFCYLTLESMGNWYWTSSPVFFLLKSYALKVWLNLSFIDIINTLFLVFFQKIL